MPARVVAAALTSKLDKISRRIAALPFEEERGVMYGKPYVAQRKALAFRLAGYEGAGYHYTGAVRRHHRAGKALEYLGGVANRILEDLGIGQTLNTGIATHYPAKLPGKSPSASRNGLGYHSDSSRNFQKGSAVVAFVFGEARPLRLRDNATRAVTSLVLAHGDAYIMLPGSQEVEKHCVPNGHGERWSVTFRTVV